jgi:hypothetical protein
MQIHESQADLSVLKGCTLASGDVEGTIRSSVQALRASQHVRNAIPTMGYVLDLYASAPGGPATGANMREVQYVLIF